MFLYGLRRESVHQIGVNENSCVGERARHSGDLLDGDAFFHQLKQAVGSDLEPAGDGDAAAVG